ncbi:hypothetical protein DMH12_16015 [Streptomyces sp. WAC 04229]|uniref:hypothetical protein n=1 Tax=Streptomyces sp. WAC 04229 TaxID=2203206 RepID=UPI000F73C851|nr:hypothetical protein [Streptomyces sp. WAC 04229]RSN54830.1 hypothetical protein DMH12_16015 [Streptomyces sp. WAC 04229]
MNKGLILIKVLTKALGTGAAAAALVMGTAFSAQAGPQVTAKANVPYLSGGRVYASATLWGPNPVGTKLCVYLNTQHPYTPDITVASGCKSLNAGTHRVSVKKPACGNMTTYAAVVYKGKTKWTGSTKYKLFC